MDPGPITNKNIAVLVEEYIDQGNPRNLKAIGNWDVSQVTDMQAIFYGYTEFNESLNDWDVSKVTNMVSMFKGCNKFNQPLDRWNVSNVTNMSSMFEYCVNFNQPLISWNVSNVTNMRNMFERASRMVEENKPSVENYKKYLQNQARDGAVEAADILTSKNLPKELTREVFKYGYGDEIGDKKNIDIAAETGYNRSIKRDDVRKNRKPSGETASDAVGGRTRRRRHNKRKSRKSRKRRYSKRR